MLSWRLWRSIVDADISNPIFRRVSQIQKPGDRLRRGFRLPLPLLLLFVLVLVASLIHSPQLLALLFAIPIVLITLIVVAPLLLPLGTLFAGGHLVLEIISGIYREKYQYTYDLLCASTQGTLYACQSFATGILHRGAWFLPLHWATLVSLRLGSLALLGLVAFITWLTLFGTNVIGLEQIRLLLLSALLLLLYYSHMTQTLVLSLIIGLYASSFGWFKRDATFVGMCLYGLLSGLPYLLAGLLLFALGRLVYEPPPLMSFAAEIVALLLIVLIREVSIELLWSLLKRRLNAS